MEDEEMEEERRLAYVGITRAEQELYITNAQMRTLYGRTNMNPVSRFIKEIPEDLLEDLNPPVESRPAARPSFMQGRGTGRSGAGINGGGINGGGAAAPKPVSRPAMHTSGGERLDWAVGDKAEHGKWGVGTVVSVKGSGDGLELDIAFPSMGIKRLLAKFAPIKKHQ
jgi:DNA helicase II / ATP-dependent DNA helicase PcrA